MIFDLTANQSDLYAHIYAHICAVAAVTLPGVLYHKVSVMYMTIQLTFGPDVNALCNSTFVLASG